MHIRQMRGWFMRLFGLFGRARREREFAEELESHLALHIADNLRAGMSPEVARRQAQIKLGGVTWTQELHREQRGLPMLETLLQDLRFGLRMLRKNPGFSLIAILTLALGVGATTTIFSAVQNILLTPLPYADAHRMVTVRIESPSTSSRRVPRTQEFLDYQEQSHAFEDVAGGTGGAALYDSGAGVEMFPCGYVTPNAF